MTYYIIDKNGNNDSNSNCNNNINKNNNNLIVDVDLMVEKNYDNCCRESSWIQQLYSLVDSDHKIIYNTANSNVGRVEEKEITINIPYGNGSNGNSGELISTSTTPTTNNNNDIVIIASLLSKLSYLNDKEVIIQYLKGISSKTHCAEKIKKLYYFKPIHSRTRLLVGFDDDDNMYCAFNGTVNSGDLILDICCGFLEKISFNDKTGPKHSLYTACSRFDWAVSIVDDLYKLAKKHRKKQLIFAGHSIGGTVALFSALESIKVKKQHEQDSDNQIELKCFTFGSPSFLHPSTRSYLDNNPKYNQVFENFLNEYDIVPMMSHHPFIFIDFMYLILCVATFIFTVGYHLTNGIGDKGTIINQLFDKLIYNIVYSFIMLSIPLLITKLMYVIYQYFFSIGYLSRQTRMYTHNVKKFIFFENQSQDVEFSFKSILNHVKKLNNYKKLLLIHDHKLEAYLTHLYHNYQLKTDGGSNIANLLKPNDINYLEHSHAVNEIYETTQSKRTKNIILKKGLILMGMSHLLWLFLSIPIFYQSLYYLCLIK